MARNLWMRRVIMIYIGQICCPKVKKCVVGPARIDKRKSNAAKSNSIDIDGEAYTWILTKISVYK